MKRIRLLAILLTLVMIVPAFAACGSTVETPTTTSEAAKTETAAPTSETATPDPTTTPAATTTPVEPSTETPAPTTETPVETPSKGLPENGVLSLLADGEATYAVEGRNPSFTGDNYDKVLVFFDFAKYNVGLDLADDTMITYSVRKPAGKTVTGTVKLDTSAKGIKTAKGYIGVCFPVDMAFDMLDSAYLDFSFTDVNGKELTAKNKRIYKGIVYYGISSKLFKDTHEGVTTKVSNNDIVQEGTVRGHKFTFTITLRKWARNTSPEQIATCAKLFWECYPRMYQRFAAVTHAPDKVELRFENEDYGIAYASGDFVHIHDQWLMSNPDDYDCLTHEFAHIIQGGWSGDYCEYSDYIETFADCCRFLYAYNNSQYNDFHWSLTQSTDEGVRHNPIRFLIWFDYFYSTPENDLLVKFAKTCYDQKYRSSQWDNAWAEIFEGTDLEGNTMEEIWEMYASTDFATLSTKQRGKKTVSEFLQKYNVREQLIERGY